MGLHFPAMVLMSSFMLYVYYLQDPEIPCPKDPNICIGFVVQLILYMAGFFFFKGEEEMLYFVDVLTCFSSVLLGFSSIHFNLGYMHYTPSPLLYNFENTSLRGVMRAQALDQSSRNFVPCVLPLDSINVFILETVYFFLGCLSVLYSFNFCFRVSESL